MKSIFLLLFALMPLLSFAQLIDELPKDESGKLYYTEVIQIDSMKKQQLYLNSKQFFVDVFKSANDVIQLDDKESGIVIGKGFSEIYIKILGTPVAEQMWFTIKIQCKDDKFKYEIYNISFKNYPGKYGVREILAEQEFDKKTYFKKDGTPRDAELKYKNEMEREIQKLSATIKSYMNKRMVTTDKNSDW